MKSFDEHLAEALAYHGHLCAGQILGVRMARLGLKELGIDEPQTYRDLITFVENDRCLTDAIGTVTCCKLGKRRLKFMDYGKSAAVFLDLAHGKAVRISSKGWIHTGGVQDIRGYLDGKDDAELFKVERVRVSLKPEDMPGKPCAKTQCSRCGEVITDGREVEKDGAILCKNCAGPSYYEVI
ncbi:MAG: FmdE family protein [Spirochaetaceae bacterium]|jgi:formylmethanofuran dehydrogenase subunit E|nr:FmdE family protein [Spirochaetaceae bacterium]